MICLAACFIHTIARLPSDLESMHSTFLFGALMHFLMFIGAYAHK